MKQTIEIEVPNDKKAVWKDGQVVFEDIKPQLPKTWKEFCENYPRKKDEYYITLNCQINSFGYDSCRNKYSDKNILPSKQAAEAHLALMQLHQLRDCYRQGWIPDWNNIDEKRYSILPYEGGQYIIARTTFSPCFLTFQSEEIAEEFLNNFRDLIEQADDLI